MSRFAYADPPYPGCAHLYRAHPDYAGEVDHAELVARLVRDYPDGWALSTSSPALWDVLPLCPRPPESRVCVWAKPFASFKPGVGVAYAWEPVIVYRGRRRTREEPTVRDWIAENITLQKGLTGAKPRAFCFWLFEVLGMQPGDEFHDLFPGTGGVMEAWREWSERRADGGFRLVQASFVETLRDLGAAPHVVEAASNAQSPTEAA
jgi:hypothetical protein